jgi:phage tail-like protein
VLLDNDGTTEVMRWNLVNAWASQWRGTMLNAMSREVAIESLTLVFEMLDRA